MFKIFADAVSKQVTSMQKGGTLFRVDMEKDELWELYLSSFPEGTNLIYKERAEHDCNNCKNFVRDAGGMVSVKDGEVLTVWDVKVPEPYQTVADALAKKVRNSKIRNVFSSVSTKVGVKSNNQMLEDGTVRTWKHFHGAVPKACTKISPSELSDIQSSVGVIRRGFEEIADEAVDVVLELINQNSLYRGEEFKKAIEEFKVLREWYKAAQNKDLFIWENHNEYGARIRNTVIGTLLQDISEGVELDRAVGAFEAKVAPMNYRRPTPVITKRMVADAMRAIREEGIEQSLYRRFATVEDISVNDILFADRSVRHAMRDSLEESLLSEVKGKPKDFSKVGEISIEDFLRNVLPDIDSMEVFFDGKHESNLMSLIGPLHGDSEPLFRWGNPFSWSYLGNVADSIKQRVKAAGGDVGGYLRVSLSWFNYDDLDLHVIEPGGNKIFFSNKRNSRTLGNLDVDMNINEGGSREAVENITWPNQIYMERGDYEVIVHNFTKRESIDVGFEVEIECQGDVYRYYYRKPVGRKEAVVVAVLTFDGERIVKIKKSPAVEEGSASKEVWGINTGDYHKVSLMTLSPNHWGGETEGNRHFLFILDKCLNPEKPRGFYNEFLPARYNKFRKVFEILGDKTKCEMSDRQLSGLGFSSTKRADLICRVTGNVNRIMKIQF